MSTLARRMVRAIIVAIAARMETAYRVSRKGERMFQDEIPSRSQLERAAAMIDEGHKGDVVVMAPCSPVEHLNEVIKVLIGQEARLHDVVVRGREAAEELASLSELREKLEELIDAYTERKQVLTGSKG